MQVKDIAAQSALTNGPVHDSKGLTLHGMTVVTSGTITGGICKLQGSPDAGTSGWYDIATRTLAAAGVFNDQAVGAHRNLRVIISSAITGGGTVDIWFTSGVHGLPNDVGFSTV